MKTIMKKMVLFPLLGVLATAPICARAHAEPWFTLGMGWWIVPVAVGGVAVYEIGRSQGESSQKTTYVPEQSSAAQPQAVAMQSPPGSAQSQGGYSKPETAYVEPARVYYQGEATYTEQQFGYELAIPAP